MHDQTALSPARPAAMPAPVPPSGLPSLTAIELIGRWVDTAELERRAFNALIRELTVSSELVETSTLDLSERFQVLANIAQAQMGRVDRIIAVAKSIEVNGEAVSLDAAMRSVEDVLRKVIETILSVSKHAMRMVYALDDVAQDVVAAEQCVAQIDALNSKTRYLALNAAIEANRSEAAGSGGAFRVIAHEMKDLSLATEKMSKEVRDRISSVTRGVRNGHKVLQEIATLDMSEHILAKERLDALIAGIIGQNRSFTAVLAEAADSSAEMANTVGQLITGMQFQDRAKQHVAQVIAVLEVLGEAIGSAQQATWAAFPGQFQAGAVDQDWLDRILDKQTLGAVKQRILARLLGAPDASAPDSGGDADQQLRDNATCSGDIELF